jgi:hypothetical protein
MQDERKTYFSNDSSARAFFAADFNKRPFVFHHDLHTHPRLGMPALRELATNMGKSERPSGYVKLPGFPRGLRWGTSEFQTVVREAFENIETSKMRMKLSSIHSELEYAQILAQCSRELTELTSVDLTRQYRDPLATLFIASPNEITYFHVDSEANFLLQIYGTKTVYIFDGNDRELLEWRELEEYWHGHGGIELREEFKSRARTFELRPGLGVHNPVHFPHWVQNGPTPSAALSLGFEPVRSSVDVLHINHYLRKLGMDPTPPGQNDHLDRAKSAVVSGARSMKRALRSS